MPHDILQDAVRRGVKSNFVKGGRLAIAVAHMYRKIAEREAANTDASKTSVLLQGRFVGADEWGM